MFTRLFCATLVVVSLSPAIDVQAGLWSDIKTAWNRKSQPVPMIDVLVVNDSPKFLLEVTGNYKIMDPNTNEQISKRFLGKRKDVETRSSGLKWGEEFPGIYQIAIVPENSTVHTVINGVEYKGTLFIYDIGGTVSVVNRVPIEDYIASTLGTRYREPMSEETLSAIAIAERTAAYHMVQNPKNKYWAVDSTQTGYRGVESENPNGGITHAINTTKHMVLSKTGAYEGKITSFPTHWTTVAGVQGAKAGVSSVISLYEADDLARSGKDAAQILSKAFPGSHIELIY